MLAAVAQNAIVRACASSPVFSGTEGCSHAGAGLLQLQPLNGSTGFETCSQQARCSGASGWIGLGGLGGQWSLSRPVRPLQVSAPQRSHGLALRAQQYELAATLRADDELRRGVAELRENFLTVKECLLHGDLHTGSVMVPRAGSSGVSKVIDGEENSWFERRSSRLGAEGEELWSNDDPRMRRAAEEIEAGEGAPSAEEGGRKEELD